MVLKVLRYKIQNCLRSSSKSVINSLRNEKCVFSHGVSEQGNRANETSQAGPWSVLFFGTDEFALQSLKKLNGQYRLNKLLHRLEIVTAYKGEENSLIRYANSHGLQIHSWPVTVSLSQFDIGLVVSFGHMIPKEMIESFPLGMINVHASLLPKWRGAAPIIHSLMNGDSHTGVTIMKIMPDKFDVGEILDQEEMSIHPDETMPELYVKLADLGANLLVKTVENLPQVLSCGRKQSESDATYARKVTAKASIIKWDKMSAKNIYDLQRALCGLYPITAKFQNKKIKLLDIRVCHDPPRLTESSQNKPGLVTYDTQKNAVIVECKDGSWISVGKIVIPGKKPMSPKDFKNGFIANRKRTSISFE